LKLLLLDDELVDWAAAHLDLSWIEHPVVRQIITARLTPSAGGARPRVTELLSDLADPGARSLVTEAASEQREIPNRGQQLADVTKRLRDQFIDRQLGEIGRRMNQPDISDVERAELFKRQQELRQAKRQPLSI
jgi:hypothetical protein